LKNEIYFSHQLWVELELLQKRILFLLKVKIKSNIQAQQSKKETLCPLKGIF
jgi:hypothetical protein